MGHQWNDGILGLPQASAEVHQLTRARLVGLLQPGQRLTSKPTITLNNVC